VYSALSEHSIKIKLLLTKNSGFKKGDGVVNQILDIQDMIFNAFNATSEVAMFFLDVANAFDHVWHEGLLHKLRVFGIGGSLLD